MTMRPAAALALAVLAGARPLAAQPAPAGAPPRLAGIVVADGARRAIFAAPDGAVTSVVEGERIDTCLVLTIVAGHVQLGTPSSPRLLSPEPDAALRAAAVPPSAPLPTGARGRAEADNNK